MNVLKDEPNTNSGLLALNAYVDTYLCKKYNREACLFYLAERTDNLVAFSQEYTTLAPTAITNFLSLLPHKKPNVGTDYNSSSKLA